MDLKKQYEVTSNLVTLSKQVSDEELRQKLLENCSVLVDDLENKFVNEQNRNDINHIKSDIESSTDECGN